MRKNRQTGKKGKDLMWKKPKETKLPVRFQIKLLLGSRGTGTGGVITATKKEEDKKKNGQSKTEKRPSPGKKKTTSKQISTG